MRHFPVELPPGAYAPGGPGLIQSFIMSWPGRGKWRSRGWNGRRTDATIRWAALAEGCLNRIPEELLSDRNNEEGVPQSGGHHKSLKMAG